MSGSNENDRVDQAIADRLGKLRTIPVDTHRLDAAIRAQIPHPNASGTRTWRLRPMPAIAAGIAIIVLVSAAVLMFVTGPVQASPSEMAQFHQDMVLGRTPVMQVDSIEAAQRAIASQWPNSPDVPAVPEQHVMACCMKSVKNKKVACVLMKDDGVPVTLTVANASDMRNPRAKVVTRGSIKYNVDSIGSLNMVMTERDGRWVCLIGELSQDRLMDIAGQLRF